MFGESAVLEWISIRRSRNDVLLHISLFSF